ncbi:S41 family peptidase [Parapedobacter deserti]|uniref:S41 family peptidase n=1 Tax=Parapedobacter deserti TaxID=1912957 RepID=A0ABV7JF80_9SPHI
MKTINLKFLVALLAMGTAIMACKRDTVVPQIERPDRPETEEDLLKDSVYIYTYKFYLWQQDLPNWFSDVRGNTERYNSADAVLETLKGYARSENGDRLDRFSFLDRWGTVNAEIQLGLAGSFGIDVRYQNETDLYIKDVEIGSPAYAAGVRRGWQVLSINGNSNLSQTSLERDNFAYIFDALDRPTISLRLRKPNGEEVSVNLNRESYQVQPITAHRVFSLGSKNVGYFAFSTFISMFSERGSPTYVKTQLDQLMAQFEEAGVKEMIVDLRYNGGGAVITAEYLSNLLVPAAANNKLMFTSKINETLSESEEWATLFAPVYFNKVNSLNLNRIYFLVTEGTASASELLINNLRPHMDVKLIGEYRTYGKPVGFFAWDILGVDLYAVSFQTFNSTGYGDYFSGMEVDKIVFDDLKRDFGDAEEGMIAEALYHARTGRFSPDDSALQMRIQGKIAGRTSNGLNRELDQRSSKGMYVFD